MARVKLKIKGVSDVLKLPAVQAEVNARAQDMAARAGEGFEAVERPHRFTSRAYVQTTRGDARGRRRQAAEHVLERVLGGG